jgi:exodeoxyribonuclease V alpha subunit
VNAHRVNRGRHRRAPAPRTAPPNRRPGRPRRCCGRGGFHFIAEEPEEILDAVKQLVAREIPQRLKLDPFEAVQVLTPMHKGLLGTLNGTPVAGLPARGASRWAGRRLFRAGDR